MNRTHCPVIIAGGGPVGLCLALALHHEGVNCMVVDRRSGPVTHSRSLGIHPVSLELFEELGLERPFLEEGIRIRRGIALDGKRKLGIVSFDRCPPPYRFILALPQYRTEQILETALKERAPGALVRGLELTGFREEDHRVEVYLREAPGDAAGREEKTRTLSCDFLVGCDGKESRVRRAAGIAREGDPYGDTYVMGDFTDNTVFGSDAAVFLCREGLVESFPLPGRQRRWVVKTGEYRGEPDRGLLEREVARRIGHDLQEEEQFMLSSFGVQRYVAETSGRGRIFLAGDAAQVVSPIGGQGMNLGWLQAQDLARTLAEALQAGENGREELVRRYAGRSLSRARKAIRRAEFNMWLGRRTAWAPLRNRLVGLALHTPVARYLARMFTMRGFKDL